MNTLEIVLRMRDEMSKELQSMTSKFEKAGQNMENVGAAMVKIGAAPTAALVLATKTAIEYESAFAGIRKTVDASEAEFSQLSNNIRKIAKEAPVSAAELSRIGELAGQLGVRGVDNLTKFVDTISKISVTTNLTSERAATDFARIANIMQEPIKNVDRMASSVVGLGNNFATTESEIVDFANRIAGAGKIAGLTTSDIFGIGTAFSSVGVEAEAGGTAVQKVLIAMTQAASGNTSEIIDNTKEIVKSSSKLEDLKVRLSIAQKQMSEFSGSVKESTRMAKQAQIDRYSSQIAQLTGNIGALNATQGQAAVSSQSFASVLGVTDEQFQKMFKKDPSGTFNKFVLELGKSGDKAMGILEDLDLTDQRLIRGFLSVGNTGDLMSRAIDMSSNAWQKNTALTTEAEKRYATTESQLKIMQNNLADIGITLGSVLLPALNKTIQAIKPFTESFAKFAEENPKLIVAVLAIGAAIGVLGVVFIFVGSMISSLGVIVGALGAVFLAVISPIGIAVAAIAALIAVGVLLYKNWDTIKAVTVEVWESIVSFFSTLPDRIGAFFTDLYLNRIPYAIGFAIGWLSVKIPEMIESMVNWFWQMVFRVGAAMFAFYDAITNAVTNAWTWITTQMPTWPEKIYNFIKSIPSRVLSVFTGAKDSAINQMTEMYDGILGIWGKIKEVFDKIKDAASQAWEATKKGFEAGRSAGLKGYATGGWVDQTGPAILHKGEYVLSNGMLNGNQSVDNRVLNNNNSRNVNITAVINNPLDMDRVLDDMMYKMNYAY